MMRRLELYDLYALLAPSPPPLGQPPSLAAVAEAASAQQLVAPLGGLSYEHVRVLLDRVSQLWLWIHMGKPMTQRVQTIPSVEQCQCAFLLAQGYAEMGFALPGVQQILAFLHMMVEDRTIPLEHRVAAKELLQEISTQLVPTIDEVTTQESSMHAALWRASMLADFEREHSKLTALLKRRWANPAARLLTLQDHYLHIPQAQLGRWRSNQCAALAHQLVGRQNGLAAGTVRQLLVQARKERRQRQQQTSPTE